MNKATLIITAILMIVVINIKAQVAVTTDGSSADPSAMLEVKSTEKGFLLPRMTQAERDAIPSPVAGLVVWCTNCGTNGEMQVFNGTVWTNMTGGTTNITCGADFTDVRDGKIYSTILIGTQCWMAENLNVGNLINSSSDQANNGVIEKYCYGNIESNCDTYGGLYQWSEIMQYSTVESVRGICPDGWHIPNNNEWYLLTNYLGDVGVAGGKMKEEGYSHWNSPNTGATNSSGFTALPGGYRSGSSFFSINNNGYFWTSTQFDGGQAWVRYLVHNSAAVTIPFLTKQFGFSVRCLKDN